MGVGTRTGKHLSGGQGAGQQEPSGKTAEEKSQPWEEESGLYAWTTAHCKQRGELAEMMFMVKATQKGFAAAKPYGDSRRYDFVLDTGERLWRVQVKSSARRIYNAYCINGRGSPSRSHPMYTPKEIDFLVGFVVPRNAWYVIPVTALMGTTLLLYPDGRRCGGRCEKFREAWNS
jgi:hypothetical protein